MGVSVVDITLQPILLNYYQSAILTRGPSGEELINKLRCFCLYFALA